MINNLVQSNIVHLLKGFKIESGVSYPINAGVLFLDVCSYTKKTEKASKKGHYGIEIITGMLNSYFDMLDKVIQDNDGYIVKYGGDAVLALFPISNTDDKNIINNLNNQLPQALKTLNLEFKQRYNEEFQYHAGYAEGICNINIVGDEKYHLDYYLTGNCLVDAYELAEQSGFNEIYGKSPGEVIENPEIDRSNYDIVSSDLFIPDDIRQKLSSGKFTAELRNTVVLFLKLHPKTGENIPNDVYNDIYLRIQRIVYGLKGIINKIDFNDKGYLLLITFGTTAISHDDIERGFTCAYRIKNSISDLVDFKIGLTHNSIYSGIIGSKQHHEFGIIGNSVNIAARLLSAIALGGIAFTENIYKKIETRFECNYVKTTTVKGIKDSIRIYSLIGEISEYRRLYETSFRDMQQIAYKDETDRVINSIFADSGSCFQMIGESGSGKSFLVYRLIIESGLDNEQVCLISADEYNSENNLEIIRQFLANYFSTNDIINDIDSLRSYCNSKKINANIEMIKEFLGNGIQGDFLFEGELSSRNKICIDQLTQIIVEILTDKKLMIIDNLHWFDNTSLEIILKAISILADNNTTTVVTSLQDMKLDSYTSIELQFLNNELTEKLVLTKIKNPTAEALNIIYSISNGNPLFIIELCRLIRRSLHDEYEILSAQHVKQFLIDGKVTDRVASFFMKEFDNLDEETQRLLKFASIIGKAFSLDELKEISGDKLTGEIQNFIGNLQNQGVIAQIDINPTLLFIFNNKLMRETIYSSILKSEKLSLHRKLGEYYEKQLSRNIIKNFELVATHYYLAEIADKTVNYAELAAEKNLRLTNYAVSLHYNRIAVKLAGKTKKGYELRLSLIDLLLRLSETNEAETLLNKIDQDDYYQKSTRISYLKARLAIYKSEYNKLVDLDVIPDIEDIFSVKTSLYKLDAYRFTGRINDFDALALSLKQLFISNNRDDYLGELLAIVGQNLIYRGEYSDAIKMYTQKLKIAKVRKDFYSIRMAYSSLGIIASRQGDQELAAKYYNEAISAADRSGDKNGYSKIMMDIGALYKNQSRFDEAEEYYKKSLSTAKAIGNKQQVSLVLYNMGEMLLWQDRYEEALSMFLKSKDIAISLFDVVSLSYCDDAIGDCYFRLNRFDEAESIYRSNEQRQLKINDREGLAHTWGNLGNIAKTKKKYDDAISYYRKQEELLCEIGDLDGQGRSLFNWAMIHILCDNKDSAVKKLQRAKDLFSKCGAIQLVDFTAQQIEKFSSE